MPLVGKIIQEAAALIPDAVYYRATDPELNKDVGEIALKGKTLVLYNNLPTIKHKVNPGGIQRNYPVEVKILRLADADDNDNDGDVIRAALMPYCDLIFDYSIQHPDVSLVTVPSTYDIDAQNQVRIYDDILTGLVLRFTLNFERSNFCIPPTPEPAPVPEP